MKKPGVILLGAMALACGSSEWSLLFAQVAPNLSSGPRDFFCAQSELLRPLDESWYTPLSRSMAPTRIPDVDASDLPSKYDSKNRPTEAGAEGNFITKPQDKKSSEGKHFRWGPAIGESLLYTGIMHTFDLSMQAGTRDSLNGHWFQHYVQSVSELRGWSDSDTFMAPYVGHPLEGSIFGYIERQNDPKYHLVQLGDGRAYWISLLRSIDGLQRSLAHAMENRPGQ